MNGIKFMSDEAKDFTQRYLELVTNELYLSATDIEQILEYEIINEDNYVPNTPEASPHNITIQAITSESLQRKIDEQTPPDA